MSVTICSFNFEDTFFNSKKRNIESTTTKIKDENVLFCGLLSIETISNSSGSWLIDNSENVDSSNGTSILSSLSLGVTEISWDSDDGRFNGFSQVSFSNFFHLSKNHWWDLFSLELFGFSLVLNNDEWFVIYTSFNFEWPKFDISLDGGILIFSTNESLCIKNSIKWISGSLVLSGISNKSFVFSEGNVWRGGVETLIICNDFDFIIHPDSYARVGSSEIDSNCSILWHFCGDFSMCFLINLF